MLGSIVGGRFLISTDLYLAFNIPALPGLEQIYRLVLLALSRGTAVEP
jgi:hypothetical protein